MFSTQYNITSHYHLSGGPVCGCTIKAPQREGRYCEGGMRLRGRFKASSNEIPLVSILTVVFNGARHIQRTIESVLVQTWQNIEYIVIDGGSHDWTQYILSSYGDAIDYFVSEPDLGLYDALNKGLSLSTGDYILILNSDDWYKPETVKILIDTLREKRIDISCGLAAEVDNAGNIISHLPDFPFNDFVYLRCPLRHELLCIPSWIYNKLGNYDTTYPIIADLEFMQRMRKASFTCHVVKDELMFFRNGGLSSNIENLKGEREHLLKKNFPFLMQEDCRFLAEMTGKHYHHTQYLLDKYASQKLFISSLQAWMRTCAMAVMA